MIEKVEVDKSKIPTLSRNEIMEVLVSSWNDVDIDYFARYKDFCLTNEFDGSEDELVLDKIYRLVGPEIVAFQAKLVVETMPNNLIKRLSEMIKKITPPKSMKGRKILQKGDVTADDGMELIDCEREEIPIGYIDPHLEMSIKIDIDTLENENQEGDSNGTATKIKLR